MNDGEGAAGSQSHAENAEANRDGALDGLADALLDVKIGEATDDIICALTSDITGLSL
jgi:hypothetical protein